MKKTVALFFLLATSACGGGDKAAPAASGTAPAASGFTIAVIPKGTTHVFWQSIRAGAEQEIGRAHV